MDPFLSRRSIQTVRWLARAWSLATIGLVVAFIIGEGVNLTGRGEAIGFVLFPLGLCIGLAIGWYDEAVGGGIAVGCLAAFYIVHVLTSGGLPDGGAWLAFAGPGFLFLGCRAMERSPHQVAAGS